MHALAQSEQGELGVDELQHGDEDALAASRPGDLGDLAEELKAEAPSPVCALGSLECMPEAPAAPPALPPAPAPPPMMPPAPPVAPEVTSASDSFNDREAWLSMGRTVESEAEKKVRLAMEDEVKMEVLHFAEVLEHQQQSIHHDTFAYYEGEFMRLKHYKLLGQGLSCICCESIVAKTRCFQSFLHFLYQRSAWAQV